MSVNSVNREGKWDDNLLALAASRAAAWPHMFAQVIARYLELNGWSEEALCAHLGCSKPTLDRLRLCSRPDPDPYSFLVDIERIAEKLGLDAAGLAAIVRDVDAADAFSAHPQAQGQAQAPFFSTSGGMLKAARDHNEDTSEGPKVEDQGLTPNDEP